MTVEEIEKEKKYYGMVELRNIFPAYFLNLWRFRDSCVSVSA